MAALDFPSNPVDGQQYSFNGVIYYYNAAMGAWLTVLSSKVTDTSANTQVLYNDAGYSNGSYGLIYNKTANTLVANTISTVRNVSVNSFIEFDANIAYDYTITTGRNALTAGPVAIANGNTVTIPNGSYWTVT